MVISKVLICDHVKVINIDDGTVRNLVPGQTYEVEHVEDERAYYVIRGTRQGAIDCYWHDLETEGKAHLQYVREDSDPTIDGVFLPITGRDQLSEHQYHTLVIGHLVKGKFRCLDCAKPDTYPQSIPIMPIHILPYSQKCGACGLQIVTIWRSAKGGWLNLHD